MNLRSYNKIVIVGNVGKEPEINSSNTGVKIAKFSVATTESFNKGGEWKDVTEWFTCVAFNKLSDIVEKHIYKGAIVIVEGRIKTNKWTDKNGVERYRQEVIASEVILISKRDSKPKQQYSQQYQSEGEKF